MSPRHNIHEDSAMRDVWRDGPPLSSDERVRAVTEEVRRVLKYHGIPVLSQEFMAMERKYRFSVPGSEAYQAQLAEAVGISLRELRRRHIAVALGLTEIATDYAVGMAMAGQAQEVVEGYGEKFSYAQRFLYEAFGVFTRPEEKREIVAALFQPGRQLPEKLTQYRERFSLPTDASLTDWEQVLMHYAATHRLSLVADLRKQVMRLLLGPTHSGNFDPRSGLVTNYGFETEKMKREHLKKAPLKGILFGIGVSAGLPGLAAVACSWATLDTVVATLRHTQSVAAKEMIDVHEIVHRESAQWNETENQGRVGFVRFTT